MKRQNFFKHVACPIGRKSDTNEVIVWIHQDTQKKRDEVLQLLRVPQEKAVFEIRTSAEINAKIQELYPEQAIGTESEAEMILRRIIETGMMLNASDILIEPEPYAGHSRDSSKQFHGKVRYDVEGVLDCAWHVPLGRKEREAIQFFPSRESYDRVIMLLRNSAKVTGVESIPGDGRYSYGDGASQVEYRVSTMPTQRGSKAVLRQISAEAKILPLNELSFPEAYNTALHEIRQKGAFVLIVGVPRAGKTTTAYALINSLPLDEMNVYTIENPVEAMIDGVSQINIPQDEESAATTQMTMNKAMRAMVRQRPDLVMVGEIRDKETVENALTIGSSGVGVVATLHAPRALASFDRLSSIGANEQVMRRNVSAIIAQELVRRLCAGCKVHDEDTQLYSASKSGCVQCSHRSYSGMIALMELVKRHDNDDGTPVWKASAIRMEDMAIRAVRDGVTDEAEIIRVFGSMPESKSPSKPVPITLARSA